jgi:16S rRNA processing protein RimM
MRVRIGTILRAHGVKGWVRARGSEALGSLASVYIDGRPHRVLHAQTDRGDHLLQLEGVKDRDEADLIRGAEIFVEQEALPPLAEGEVYAADLVGCKVIDATGRELGEVTGSFPGGGHEVLEVKGAHDFMLPLVIPQIVTEIDVKQRRIICDPPEGLVDLDKAE